ncbi:Zinc finger CCCH domain-containing protein 44 [Dichanthelium oligosanthes]|uniref:Zinc finger CCCH domain-containing protein 44 n=1 Tax=Dichanthelium oligosanthes TaxID=888268 RepID=A0A1E5UT96_9POAL|nr:Zinc finger CCCH domain-containing protein 44 [Dichanthelium oligosanthes]
MDPEPAGADQLTPAEADWPLELRLPPPPPAEPPPPAQAAGMDDSQFLGSIMGVPPRQEPTTAPKRRGRPPKKKDGAAAGAALAAAAPKPARRKEDEEEVVCFICFDGGNLVVCDRRWVPCRVGCRVARETRDALRSTIRRASSATRPSSSPGASGTAVDFDDVLSWEYLFKLYWVDLKGKLSLTLEELTSAKNRWNAPITSARKEKDESSDDLYDVNNDDDAGSDCSSRKRRRGNSSRKKVRKRRKIDSDCSIAVKKVELPIRDAGSLATKVPNEQVPLPGDTKVPNEQVPLPVDTKVPNEQVPLPVDMEVQNELVPLPVDMEVQNELVPLPVDMKWASPELLEFIGHMRGGDQSFISQFDVQTLLLEYIKKNNLRDPKRKSQIVCDTRLHRLFRKSRVAHFEMLTLLEMHFLMNETPKVSDNSQVTINLISSQVDTNGYSDMSVKLSPDKRRRMHKKMDREPQVNLEAYAAVDMHNINLIYMRRSLMEDLINDATFSDKIYGGFVRIKISGVGQKQDIYRLVKVVGTHKVPEKYSIGKKMTNFALEILNLDKKEIITMDTISNQDFTEEECNRLRQSMKCGLISRLKVGDIQEKAKILQSVRVNDLPSCHSFEKLQLLNSSEERTRRIHEVLEVHVDSHMDPNYESAEEKDDKKTVGRSVNRTRSDPSISRRKSKYPNTMQNHPQKVSDSSRHPKKLTTESTIHGSGAGRKFENNTIANSAMYETGSLSSSGVTMSSDTEPEKVWHYKDPSGNVQGPFTLLQLSKWTSYFPRDLRVWLTFESEERSLLLTEVLSKQQKDFTQAASLTSSKATLAGTRHTMNSPGVDQTNALSPVGYSMAGSSGITVQSNKYYVPERESVYSPDDSLSLSTSSVAPKDVHTVNSQAQCQTKHSVYIQSPGNSYGQTDLHHDGIQGGCSGESNHRHSSGALWSPTTAHMSCSVRGNLESHQDQQVSWSQCRHDSKGSSQGGSIKDLNSRRDLSKNLPTQRVGKDVSSPLFAWSPSESRTASSQHEGSCLSSTTNPNFLDELHSSIASAKPTSCAPATPIEDRGSSSPSGMLSHSERVPMGSPHSAPLASASNICKMDEIMNQQRTLEADTSNASVNQSPQSKIFHVSSPDNQDIDREAPSPTPRSENKELAVDNSGLTPASPENVTATYSPGSDTRKVEEIVSQQKVPEAAASNSSDNHSPSKVSPVSSPKNKDLECECPSSSPRSEDKVPSADNSVLTSAAHENLMATSAPASDTCKMEEFVNQQKTLDADASDAPIFQPPHSHIFPESSPDNQDIGRECPSPAPRSDSNEPLLDNSVLTSTAPENLTTASASTSDTCKMEEFVNEQKAPISDSKEPLVDNSVLTSTEPENLAASASASNTCKMEELMNQQKTLETDASNAPLNQPPDSHSFPVSSPDNQDIECESPSPTPRSDSKEPFVDNLVLTSAGPENLPTTSAPASGTCKVEILNKERTLEADASNVSLNQPPHSSIFPLCPVNQDMECEYPSPRSKIEQPLMDDSGLTSIVPENLSSTSASASDLCKMEEILNEKRTLVAYASNGSVTQSPQSKVFLVSSPYVLDIERGFPSTSPRPEIKEPVVDSSVLTSAVPENLTKQHVDSPDAFLSPKSGPPTGELGAMKSDFKCEETIQKELYCESESTVITTGNMLIDPSCGAESIDVSDVLESLMEEQRCGTSYMQGTTDLEDFLATSAEEEPQCSSPIALSPWGEPSYYQGDAVDSELWGVQDDPINDMWSLLSPRPMLQPSSGIGTEGKETYDINEVGLGHGNNEIFQRGSVPGEDNVNQASLGAPTDWVLPEQVPSIPNDMSMPSANESTRVVGWQPSANQRLNEGTTWSTSQNLNLSSNEKAEPSSKRTWEASRKQESTNSGVSSSGEAIGNTRKGLNPPSGYANRGSQRSHHNRDSCATTISSRTDTPDVLETVISD